jgi:hypothetical protein
MSIPVSGIIVFIQTRAPVTVADIFYRIHLLIHADSALITGKHEGNESYLTNVLIHSSLETLARWRFLSGRCQPSPLAGPGRLACCKMCKVKRKIRNHTLEQTNKYVLAQTWRTLSPRSNRASHCSQAWYGLCFRICSVSSAPTWIKFLMLANRCDADSIKYFDHKTPSARETCDFENCMKPIDLNGYDGSGDSFW